MVVGGNASFFKFLRAAAILLVVLLPFQNCGTDYSADKNGLYSGEGSTDKDCMSDVVDCGARQEFLQITLDLANPSDFTGFGNVTLYGRCNVGNYDDHYIHWEIRNSSSAPIAQNNETAACVRGHYQFNVSLAGVASAQLYTIFVNIVGIDKSGASYRNLQANGSAEIDFSK